MAGALLSAHGRMDAQTVRLRPLLLAILNENHKKVYDHGHAVETGLRSTDATDDGLRRDGAAAAGGPEAQTETFL